MTNRQPRERPAKPSRGQTRAPALAFLLCVLGLFCVPLLLRAQAPASKYRLDSTLLLLGSLRRQTAEPPNLRSVLNAPTASVSVRFRRGAHVASLDLRRMERELGMTFTRLNGTIAIVGTVVGAQVPWGSLDRLAQWPSVDRVDSTWKPSVATPLDASIPEVHADRVWSAVDVAGWPVTGRGVVVADFDTGIDVFHPDFWRADGGTYSWIDSNGNGGFDPGIDAVDLDGSGSAAVTERLSLLNSSSLPEDPVPDTNDQVFQPGTDWLYNDANGNGWRDYGITAGFSEQSPTYGERLYLAQDSNGNGRLDLGEVLIALGTCKVSRTLGANAVESVRGVNLISNPPDDHAGGHGTQVCSVLSGGIPGLRRHVGVAPGCTLLVADRYSNAYTTYIPWAEENGAKVMLYEFGGWVFEFLDGSSNLEQMLDCESRNGIAQVVPAGNLADGKKHAQRILDTAGPSDVPFSVPYGWGLTQAYLSVLWSGPTESVAVQMVAPSGATVVLPGDGTWVQLDGHLLWSATDHSSSGTSRFDVYADRAGAPLAEGDWSLRLSNRTSSWLNTHAYVSDNLGLWVGGITFTDAIVQRMYTVTTPGTAGSAITVASYATRGRGPYAIRQGEVSQFSGRGPRIDGQSVLDIAAPGHYDLACASSKDVAGAGPGQYAWFGGTSGAAPHVAGTIALLLQSNPQLSPDAVTQLLRQTARLDASTGIVPNEIWGYGKLDAAAAWAALPVTATPTITDTPTTPTALASPTPTLTVEPTPTFTTTPTFGHTPTRTRGPTPSTTQTRTPLTTSTATKTSTPRARILLPIVIMAVR